MNDRTAWFQGWAVTRKGSSTSGNYAHRGRRGKQGGSMPGGGHGAIGIPAGATPDEIKEGVEARREEAQEGEESGTPQIREGTEEDIRDFQLYDEENEGEEIIVAEAGDEVVGYAQVTGGDIFFLESERRGTGRTLVDFLKEREDYLVAHAVEETARGFWEKMGFQFARRDFFGGEVWDWEEDS